MEMQIAGLLRKVSASLSQFLSAELPLIHDAWWEDGVMPHLSARQHEEHDPENRTLDSLDLATLLRVLDRNWYQLSSRLGLTIEDPNYSKEMQTIRDRWDHMNTSEADPDDTLRDVDTVCRFAMVIRAQPGLVNELEQARAAFRGLSIHCPNPQRDSSEDTTDVDKRASNYEVGQYVSPRSTPSETGLISKVIGGGEETRYEVFVNNERQIFYESQIQLATQTEQPTILPWDECRARVTAIQIRHPSSSALYSLDAARIDYIPYQFRPVLKFIRSDRPRLLIADSVGVGKTIEAGLILTELQARQQVRSILVICPRPLVIERKWKNEMRRFGISLSHLDGPMLRECIKETDREGVWPEALSRVVIPFSLFDETTVLGRSSGHRSRRKGLLELDPPPQFDFVVVDEAHHIRNPETFNHRATRLFCDNAEAVLFLTATPMQTTSEDLFVLLNMLRPDLVIDKESYKEMMAPNPWINQAVAFARSMEDGWEQEAAAALDKASRTPWGKAILRSHPLYKGIQKSLLHAPLQSEERVRLVTHMESLHTLDNLVNRTRRRDIGDFAVRQPQTIEVSFTSQQQRLHDDLLEIQAEIHREIHSDVNVAFLMSTIRRQASSCIYGLVPFFESILTRHWDELALEEAENACGGSASKEALDRVRPRIEGLMEKARSLNPEDPKIEKLKEVIRKKQEAENNKVMLFSTFRHTLEYINAQLLADRIRVGLVHGGVHDEERIELRERFALDREDPNGLDVLLFSEIGCEGLDYQFCDCIVNYDLPWNPMKIEQRIGRVDRWGQQSPTVAIVNLITRNTVDAEIYERCLRRIGVFERELGASEKILADMSGVLRAIDLNLSLSEDERRGKLDQLSDNVIRLVNEQERLETREAELFGIRVSKHQTEESIENASSSWLHSESIHNLVMQYLRKLSGEDRDFISGDGSLQTLRLSGPIREALLKDFRRLPRSRELSYREWETWLAGRDSRLEIAFDSSSAIQNVGAAFITATHPLVKQAAASLQSTGKFVTALQVFDETEAPGLHLIALYRWQYYGIKEDQEVRAVGESEGLSKRLPELLSRAKAIPDGVVPIPELTSWEPLEQQHYRLFASARDQHRERIRDLSEHRLESLKASHTGRITQLEDQLTKATDDRITRMRSNQISNANADYDRRTEEITQSVESADIRTQPVAFCILKIERGGK
jgi:ATP-dependent helicase HepA